MEINGLPLHPLVVHAAVVFGPLAALGALAYVAPSRLAGPAALADGGRGAPGNRGDRGRLLHRHQLLQQRPDLHQLPSLATHKSRGRILFWITLPFGVLAAVTGVWLHERDGAARLVPNVVLGVAALAVLVQVVLTADAGARSVWGR